MNQAAMYLMDNDEEPTMDQCEAWRIHESVRDDGVVVFRFPDTSLLGSDMGELFLMSENE